ncbi:MAG TPA: ParA family protein [Pirellulales bacterium]|nr:ParA family protein [Pirellulales bacterium]
MLARLPAGWYLPDMMISVTNFKGGVGKTTVAVHCAMWCASQGITVGFIDGDTQASSSQWLAEAQPDLPCRLVTTPEECLAAARELSDQCDVIVGDGPAGLGEISRTLLILSEIAIIPVTPSALDIRSVQQAISVLKFAKELNLGRPEGWLVLNRMRKRDTISRELIATAPQLGLRVGNTSIRDLQAYRDAVQQGTVVMRMGLRAAGAARDMEQLFQEILSERLRGIVGNRNQSMNFKRAQNG